MADPDSLVGSIGVISTYMIYQNLLEEKLGINMTVIKSGEYKDIGSPYRQMTPEEQQRMQEIVDSVYKEFIQVITSKRTINQDSLDEISTGAIFLGSKAVELGLLDSTGSFDDALEKARELSKSPDAEPYYVRSSDYLQSDLYYRLGKGVGDSLASKLEISKGELSFK
jgi:protease-4